MTGARLVLGTALVIASLATFGAPPAGNGAPQGNAARGKSLFTSEMCWTCHGTEGHGSVYAPRLTPHLFPWESFTNQVRHPAKSMPAYAPRYMTDKDLADIYAYLASIPEGPKANSIAILKE